MCSCLIYYLYSITTLQYAIYKYRYIIMTKIMIITSSDSCTQCKSNRWINTSVFINVKLRRTNDI